MKIFGNKAPKNSYSLEFNPRDDSQIKIKFFDDVFKIKEELYSWNEYSLWINNRKDIVEYVKSNKDKLFLQAKNESNDVQKQMRADVDYLAMLMGVEL